MDVRAVVKAGCFRKPMRVVSHYRAHTVVFRLLSGAIRPDTIFPSGDHRLGWAPAQIATWCCRAESVLAAVPAPRGRPGGKQRYASALPSNGFDVIPGI